MKYPGKCLCCLFILFAIVITPAMAEKIPENPPIKKDTIYSTTSIKLNESMQEALDIEEKSINKIDLQISEEEAFSKNMFLEFSAFRLQFATHANLILLPDTPVKSLEKASADHIIALNKIRVRIQEINQRVQEVNSLIDRTTEQVIINEKQLADLKTSNDKTEEVKTLISGYSKLLKKIYLKQKLLKNLRDIYHSVVANITMVEDDFKLLSNKFDQEIRARKRKNLFQRNVFHMENTGGILINDSGKLFAQFLPMLSASFWIKEIEFVKTAGNFNIILFFGLYGIVILLFLRLKRFLNILKKKELLKTFWITLSIQMIDKTFFLLTTVIFLFIFSLSGILYAKNPLILTILNLLAVWLFSKWFLLFLVKCAEEKKETAFLTIFVKLRILVYISRVFAIACILGNFVYIDPNIVFIAVRLVFLSILYGWCIWFWRHFYKYSPQLTGENARKKMIIVTTVQYLIYVILSVGFIADLTGFGTFAFFWLTSWARSSVVILWSLLLFLCIDELSNKNSLPASSTQEDDPVKTIPIHWFVSRIGLLLLVVSVFVCLVYAWGGKQAVLINIYTILEKPFNIGSWGISILNIVFAVIALFITNAVAVTWRQFFQEIILKESGIDIGAQESMSMISYYIIWFIGILVSLNLLGVSMKSVTVIFGALGIGLGFGLQTIFNNFISGIILLFERPIQVGDDLEIDGVWATVRKINVRSTVVQTYDNATLIIPNSDFISAKVINWSFKDKRLRRKIEVGVAYGSDIELVRKTMLEVADKTQRILKLPKSEVLFTNFGDNSLIFVLRFWTRVEYFMQVETAVRFEIDRLFRERNIEISFPQSDIHIRSINQEDFKAVLSQTNKQDQTI